MTLKAAGEVLEDGVRHSPTDVPEYLGDQEERGGGISEERLAGLFVDDTIYLFFFFFFFFFIFFLIFIIFTLIFVIF